MTPVDRKTDARLQRIVADAIPPPRRIPFDAPWMWLAAGWRDLWRTPALSLCYGALFALAAALILFGLARQQAHALFLALAGGFLLIGPLAAVGLYEASRRLTTGLTVTLMDMLRAGQRAQTQLLFFGAILTFAFLVWMRIAMLLLALFLGSATVPPPAEFMQALLFTSSGLGLLVTGTFCGGLIAAVIYAGSVVAVPILLAYRTDPVTAARASVAAVLANPRPMVLWSVLIAAMMAAGFASLLIGLVVAFPLIGHASWHAFQDLYGDQTRE